MTQEERIKYVDEIERINGLTLEHIYNMNPVNLWKLTDQFSEPLVRLILTKATTNEEQSEMIRSLKADFLEACEEIANPTHSTGVRFFPPEYFSDLEYDIDCNRIITLDGSKPAPKHASLTITPVSGSIPSTQDDKNKLIAELKAECELLRQQVKELQNNKLDSITEEEFNEIFPLDDNIQTRCNTQPPTYNVQPKSEIVIPKSQRQDEGASAESKEELLARVESLENDLQAFNTQDKKGHKSPLLTVKQMAIFLKAILLSHNSLTSKVKALAPLLQMFGGWTEHTAEKALGYKISQEECEKLAGHFYNAPKIANIIKAFPQAWEEERKKRLNNNFLR